MKGRIAMKKRIAALVCALVICLGAVSCSDDKADDTSVPSLAEQSESSALSSESGESKADTSADDSSQPAVDRPTPQEAKYVSGTGTVAFGTKSGFYDNDIELTLTASDPECFIFYTTDGSDPDMNSQFYTGPIKITNRSSQKNDLSAEKDISPSNDHVVSSRVTKGTVIKAAAFRSDGSRGDISFGSYFVGIDRQKLYGDVPIISVAIRKEYLFDHETGIYVLGAKHEEWLAEDPNNKNLDGWMHQGNYSERGKEWERRAGVELIEADGSVGFSQDLGVRIKGGASRGEAQKSLKFIAREEYGKKSVKYEMIPDNMRSDGTGTVDKYKSFAIRNGGNDCNFARLRDPFLQYMVKDRDFEIQGSRVCVAFINGEYWGMYTIRDDYTDNYFENNYPIKDDNVILVKRGELEEGEEGDLDLFNDMVSFINSNDMSVGENYRKASEMLDMQSFADFAAFEIYINNEDGLFKNNNNWRLWRARTPDSSCEQADGRWRVAVYDTDFSTGIYSGDKAVRQSLLGTAMNGRNFDRDSFQRIFSSLCANGDFKKMFANALLDIRNYNFDSGRVVSELGTFSADYIKLMPATYARFGPDYIWDKNHTANQIGQLRNYLIKRYSFMPGNVQDNLELGEIHKAEIYTGDGNIIANNSELKAGSHFTACYLSECPVTLTAKAPEGKRFVRWEISGITAGDTSSETITLSITSDCTVKAVFE